MTSKQRRYDDQYTTHVGKQRGGWYFERRISLDTIVAVVLLSIALGGPFIVWGRAMEARVLALELHDEARLKNFESIAKSLEKLNEQMTQAQIQLGVLTGNKK
jgi:hypothetical protein